MSPATLLTSPLAKRALRFGVTGVGVTALHVVIAAGLGGVAIAEKASDLIRG